MNYNKEINREYGQWLSTFKWDLFSTITYKHDINRRRNRQIMTGFIHRLEKQHLPHVVFWVMEYTSNGYQTHNHLLIEGEGVQYELDKYLKEKNLVNERNVKHLAYNGSLGASHYVSKFITLENIEYDISSNK